MGSKPNRATLSSDALRRRRLPLVSIKTGFSTADGKEEILTEYLCDWPGCPNLAIHTLGSIRDIRALAIVCEVHRPSSQRQPSA
jgi:hypothetical protein